MQRSTAVLLVAGGTGLLVTLGVLVRAVHSETSVADASPPSHPSAAIASRGESDSATPAWRAPAAQRMRRDEADDSSSAPSAPSGDEQAPAPTRANTDHLEFGGKQLRAQTAAVEPLVVKCIDDAVAAGQSPTGQATLTYIVGQKGDKVSVEDTGIDEDKTTLPAGTLLDCLRETSRSMKFEGLPHQAEGIVGIVVTRAVTVDHGKLVENKHVTFSYLR